MAGELIFVCGGVRSGKSTFAEEVAVSLSRRSGNSLHYIACGKAVDEEMKQRINRHQCDRKESLAKWKTWEKPTSIGELADRFTERDIVLVDCITTLVTNELFGDGTPTKDVIGKVMKDIEGIVSKAGSVILVSNDVFCEPLSEVELVKRFVRNLGTVHQQIAERAERAYSVNKGIAVMKKRERKMGG
ncbi:bifunctional adenosylcobinamide kinase/adenosylcobinamide-phosphate guanylyltransferase [Bacillus salacetis]|uniref:bifunctional adenosylcobinamide kinase/adenosylcobinamide-phosphate guanylyltransferase n=1 Tax=Bacillus salacetis TaxID=2315464 RepID=UPI003B9F4BAC